MQTQQASNNPQDPILPTETKDVLSEPVSEESRSTKSKKKIFIGLVILLFIVIGFSGLVILKNFLIPERREPDISQNQQAVDNNQDINSQNEPQVYYSIKTIKKLLFEIPPEHAHPTSIISDTNFKYFAYTARNAYGNEDTFDDKNFLVLDGQVVTDDFDLIEQIRFSPDEKYISFIAMNFVGSRYESGYEREAIIERDDYSLVLIDLDTRKKKIIPNVDWYQYTPSGSNFAYKTIDENKTREYLVVNGKEHRQFPGNLDQGFVFSPNGMNFIYSGRKYSQDRSQFWSYVVVNETIFEPFNRVGKKVINNHGEFYFVVQDEESLEWYVQTNDNRYGPFKTSSQIFNFGTNETTNLKDWCKVTDNRELPSIVLSRDMMQCAFEENSYIHSTKPERIVLNGKPQQYYEKVYDPTFSSDGEYFGYRARKDGKIILVIDGVESVQYDAAQPPIFCDEGNHVAYVAFIDIDEKNWVSKRESFYVVNGDELERFDWVKSGRFSENCSKFTYLAESENKLLVLENVITPEK